MSDEAHEEETLPQGGEQPSSIPDTTPTDGAEASEPTAVDDSASVTSPPSSAKIVIAKTKPVPGDVKDKTIIRIHGKNGTRNIPVTHKN